MLSGKGYSGNMFVGSKYNETSNLDISEIAKLVRTELKSEFPNAKFAVTISRFSGGRSMDITIKEVGFNPFSTEYNDFLKSNEKLSEWNKNAFYKWDAIPTYNEKFEELRKRVESIVNQYNFDDSDSMSDYSHVRFYSHVRMDENAYIQKYHPNHIETNERIASDLAWEAKRKAKNAAVREYKEKACGGFKKGDKAFYIYDKDSSQIPKGEYECTILKVPNGRAMFSTFTIRYMLNKKYDANRNVVELTSPIQYTTEVYDISKLKPSKDKQRKNAIQDFLENA
jgi:hypothetical protein